MKRILFIVAILVASIIALVSRRTQVVATNSNPHSLAGLSDADVSQYALGMAIHQFRVASGTPQVVLVQRGTPAEIRATKAMQSGFPGVQRVILVVIRGDFDVSKGLHALAPANQDYHYIGYGFDEATGLPWETHASPHGGWFSTVLHDPTLVDP